MNGNVYAIDRRNHIHVFTNGVAPEPDGTLSIVDENVARAMLMDVTGCERRDISGLVEEYARMYPSRVDGVACPPLTARPWRTDCRQYGPAVGAGLAGPRRPLAYAALILDGEPEPYLRAAAKA